MDTISAIRHRSRSGLSFGLAARHLARLLVAVAERLESMMEKRRSRRALLELSDEQLKDIGISRADAVREGIRPFWD
ncbi:DUF1127 domain-containing protein [Chelativorans alearense]|uniref:DUF1127 domain-containing protein n=1 Tax=Chelativorans alearense TaxID=2681495 RepID=UPI0013D16926|nr:DUF1127 domain-containing protein [Chelativorans alearense]